VEERKRNVRVARVVAVLDLYSVARKARSLCSRELNTLLEEGMWHDGIVASVQNTGSTT
jgi:hypothetical protein